MIDNALGTAPTWLRGDMHNHCEDRDLVLAHLEGAGEHLDFIALTNHAQKPIFFEQHHMVERIRAALPGLPVFFGLEWNAPAGTHAGVIFPPGAPDVETALAHLADLPAAERPIIFFNHPAPGQWNPESIDRYLAADPNELIVGLKALHGHQAHAKIAALDPCTYPGAAVGGLAERVYASGQPFSLLLHSDFHVHKQARQRGFVRLRIIAQSPDRLAPGPPGPRHFLTSAILLDTGD